jgi:hypothetical protein
MSKTSQKEIPKPRLPRPEAVVPPGIRLIRRPEVLAILSINRSALAEGVVRKEIPAPVKVTEGGRQRLGSMTRSSSMLKTAS